MRISRNNILYLCSKYFVPGYMYNMHITLFFSRRSTSALSEPQSLGPPQVTSIVSFSKGFACSCGPGCVAWFEKTDDKEYFKKVRMVSIMKMCSIDLIGLWSSLLDFQYLNRLGR